VQETYSSSKRRVRQSSELLVQQLCSEASLPDRALRRSLSKWQTCRYTSAEQCTLEDFTCQICLRPLKDCVTIEPCGHNFCATCLSNYVSSRLDNGADMTCPLRCPNPQRFVKNDTVRNLVDKKKREFERRDVSFGIDDELDEIIEGDFRLKESIGMSCACR